MVFYFMSISYISLTLGYSVKGCFLLPRCDEGVVQKNANHSLRHKNLYKLKKSDIFENC